MKKKLFALFTVTLMLTLTAANVCAVGMGGGVGGDVGSSAGGSMGGGIGVGDSARDGFSDSQSGEAGDTVDPDTGTHGDMTTEDNSLNDDTGYDAGEGEGTRRGNTGVVIMALLLAAGIVAVVVALVRRNR